MFASCFPKALFVLILGTVAWTFHAQDIFNEGDRLDAAGLPDEAITSYLRGVYTHPGSPYVSELYARIARCYARLFDFDRAVRSVSLAVRSAGTDAELQDRRFFRVELLLAGQRYRAAEKDLEEMAGLPWPAPAQTRLHFLSGVCSLYLHDWETALLHLSIYFADTDTYPPKTERRVLKLLSFARDMWQPDPGTAKVLSVIVPGWGQAYAGDAARGINSLAVTGGAGMLMVLASVGGDWPDAITLGYFLFLHFYLGSPYHAERIAREKGEERSDAVLRSILNLLVQ